MYDILKDFVKPELLILIPVLYIIGASLKRSKMSDKLIPWLLGAVSVLLCALYILSSCSIVGWKSFLLGVFTAITQGILIAGTSVYFNQLIKQTNKSENQEEKK